MHALSAVLAGDIQPVSKKKCSYRRDARFVINPGALSTPLDGNQRARILHAAEVMERKTKRKGCRNGILGVPALMVLRCLLMRFHNRGTGLCFPSYSAIQKATGLCRQSIASALHRLESAGLLVITRRLVRVAGMFGGTICQQCSNLYAFAEPTKQLDLGTLTAPPRLSPRPRVHQMDCNLHQIFPNRGKSLLREAFSPQAIQERRTKAGLR